jgi:hypothetical protein
LKAWQESGILPPSAGALTIATAAETPQLTIVRQAIRESIAMRTGMALPRPVAKPEAAEEQARPVAPIEITQKPRRGGGIFTGSLDVGD